MASIDFRHIDRRAHARARRSSCCERGRQPRAARGRDAPRRLPVVHDVGRVARLPATRRSAALPRRPSPTGWTRDEDEGRRPTSRTTLRRAAHHPRGDRARRAADDGRQPGVGRRRGDRQHGAGWPRSTRTGSRSRPTPTTCSGTPGSPARSRPIRVATGEVAANRVIFKQLLQAAAIGVCQVDACRVGGVNEVLAGAAAGGASSGCRSARTPAASGLCEYVQHLAIFDYLRVGASLDGRMVEYVDHLHEHFVRSGPVRDGRYLAARARPATARRCSPSRSPSTRSPAAPHGAVRSRAGCGSGPRARGRQAASEPEAARERSA